MRSRMYTFRWSDLCDVLPDQDPADDVVRSPMNQDPIVLLPLEGRKRVIDDLNDRTKRIDFPYVLQYEEEAEIYRKMLDNADVPDIHVGHCSFRSL